MQMNWNYLAGFIDGEGCLCIRMSPSKTTLSGFRYSASLSIGNTNKRVLDLIQQFLKINEIKSNICIMIPDKRTSEPKPAWNLTVLAKGLDMILPILEPLLIIKREQAVTVLKFRSVVQGHGHWLSEQDKDKMKNLAEYNSLLNKYGR